MNTRSMKPAIRVAAAALTSAVLTGGILYAAAWLARPTVALDAWWWASLGAAALAGALAAAISVRRALGSQLGELAERLDGRVDETDFLARLPDMGDDEVGRIAAAINRLLERITMLQGDVIDRGRELEGAHRALALVEELAQKQHELELRLRERALLFEVLRESTESHDLDKVLDTLVDKVGTAMRLAKFAVLLREDSGSFKVRAAWGFDLEESVVGDRVSRPGAGPWSVDQGMLLIPDLSRAPGAAAFWDALVNEGSLAVIPVTHRGDEIGHLVMTRDLDDPLTELEGRYLEAVADQAALAIHNAQLIARLEDLSTHDALTGLPNRRLLSRRLDRALVRADRYREPVGVLALDIDHFKKFNDRCGHPAGDAALVAIAGVLTKSLREIDTPSRIGGEELVVLLPNTDLEGAIDVAEKLRGLVAALDLEGASGQPLGHLSVSIGVASRQTDESAADLLARADTALYDAKRSGRDRVTAAKE